MLTLLPWESGGCAETRPRLINIAISRHRISAYCTLVCTCLSSYGREDVTVLGSMCVHNTVTPPQAAWVEKKL